MWASQLISNEMNKRIYLPWIWSLWCLALEFSNYSSDEFFMVIIPNLTLNFTLQLGNFTNHFISPPTYSLDVYLNIYRCISISEMLLPMPDS